MIDSGFDRIEQALSQLVVVVEGERDKVTDFVGQLILIIKLWRQSPAPEVQFLLNILQKQISDHFDFSEQDFE